MDRYPLEIRFRNNMKLLKLEEKKPKINIDKLSPAEMKALLEKLLS